MDSLLDAKHLERTDSFTIPKLGLAPMEGVTSFPVRIWLNLTGSPDFALTPFFRITTGFPLRKIPSDFCPEKDDAAPFHHTGSSSLKNQPQKIFQARVEPQIMGSCPLEISRVARHLLIEHPQVNLNFGCPAPQVVGHHAGSGLIRCHKALTEFLKIYFENSPSKGTTIKTRVGFHSKSEAEDLLAVFSKFPINKLTLHGRTREQKYTGFADWFLIQELAHRAPFPVIPSGDMVSFESFHRCQTACTSSEEFLIGRGAMRNPWLFHEIRQAKNVELEYRTLSCALQVFLLLQDLCESDFFTSFLTTFSDFELLDWNSMKHSSWQNLWNILWEKRSQWISLNTIELKNSNRSMTSCTHSIEDWLAGCSRGSLSKLKMLWNFLRTSLPDAFQNPRILRVNSAAEFFAILDDISQNKWEEDQKLELRHREELNWMFSGEKKTHVN